MKTIDASNFEGDPIEIKTKHKGNPDGKNYTIDFVDAIYEIKLMQMQEDITKKAGKWQNIEQQDFEKWKDLIKKIIKSNSKIQIIDDAQLDRDINLMSPPHLLGVLMALVTYMNQKSKIIFEGLDPEVQKEAKEMTDDIKKKTMENLL